MELITYTIIVPRADRTGPTNVAVDIGRAAINAGWSVRLLYLSGLPERDDLEEFGELRKFQFKDLWKIKGIIHTHGFRPDLIGWLCSWLNQAKIVTTLHGHFPHHLYFDYSRWKVFLAWKLWSSALNRFDQCICISRTMQRHYSKLLPKRRFELAYNFRSFGAENQKNYRQDIFQWVEEMRKEKKVVLAYVGSLITRKNVLPLVKKVSQSPGLALILCGQGPLCKELQCFVDKISCSSIYLAGQLPFPDEILQVSDMLVLPSHAEGLPLVILEAARIGVPSLLSNIAVHRELAASGLGKTFDRFEFSDFYDKAIELKNQRSSRTDHLLIQTWEKSFSPEVGFLVYKNLFLSMYKN